MPRLTRLLINRNRDRNAFEQERSREHAVSPSQFLRRVRVVELHDALVNRVSRADAEDEYRRDERPEEALLPVSERVLLRRGAAVESQAEQQKNLVRRVGQRVQSLGHHSRRTRDAGGYKFKYSYQRVGDERADHSQHRRPPPLCACTPPRRLCCKNRRKSTRLSID